MAKRKQYSRRRAALAPKRKSATLLAFRCKWKYAVPKGCFPRLWIDGQREKFGMTEGSVLRRKIND